MIIQCATESATARDAYLVIYHSGSKISGKQGFLTARRAPTDYRYWAVVLLIVRDHKSHLLSIQSLLKEEKLNG